MAEQQEQQAQQAAFYSKSSAQRLQADGLVLLGLGAAPRGRQVGGFGCRLAGLAGQAGECVG
jgi:hypothetical protein